MDLQASTRPWFTGLFLSASNNEERYSSFQPGMMGGFITGTEVRVPAAGVVCKSTCTSLFSFLSGSSGEKGNDEVEMTSQSSSDDDPSMFHAGGAGGDICCGLELGAACGKRTAESGLRKAECGKRMLAMLPLLLAMQWGGCLSIAWDGVP